VPGNFTAHFAVNGTRNATGGRLIRFFKFLQHRDFRLRSQ
jgi:hypothetical protein